ncbi:MAG: discoidin domain-containing protein [Phycisphaerales bacterium]|nr:MAG: discoidin domain-containing protein [Phycisphaerales bacterium]
MRGKLIVLNCLLLLGFTQPGVATLIAYWPLDGDARDAVGPHHGTLVGGASFVNDTTRRTVLSVDGVNGHIEVPASNDMVFSSADSYTIMAWVYLEALPGSWQTVMAKSRDQGTHYGIWITDTGEWMGGGWENRGSPATTQTWVHVAYVQDGVAGTGTTYIDGAVDWSGGPRDGTGAGDFWIGGAASVTEFLRGMIDEVRVYDQALTEAEILIAMRGNAAPELAADPLPEDEVTDVPRDGDLSWTPGQFAATHDVYFGTSFDDVNAASRSNPMGVLARQGQTSAAYDHGRLEFSETYYWRVDEVNAAPDSTIYKGAVWSFTTEPLAYPIENVIATSNGNSSDTEGPENIVNGSGLNSSDQHSTAAPDMWLATPGAEPLYLQFEFDTVYQLHEMLVWNYNVQFELILGFGLKDVTVEYSRDGVDWAVLGDVELARATARADYDAYTTVAFDSVAAKYVRLNVNSGWGMMGQFGLSEVRFLFIPAQARQPRPADAETAVEVDTTLQWRAGRQAGSHEVYLDVDGTAVAQGAALVDTVAESSYTPAALELGTTYYWKINEVNEAEAISMWEGEVWSFSTEEYVVVDDFESYDDEGNRIYDTWIDGWVNETGSTVGHLEAPFAEESIVHSGRQSMPLFYDNAGVATSEAELALAQDWTAHGIESLSLYLRGATTNNGGQLYVTINGTKVPYDGDASDINRAVWQPWNIDLAALGMNLQNVTTLIIGIEGAGAQGILYIDDIRLYAGAVERITPTEPDSEALVAHYALEGNPNDSSGNGYHGTEIDGISYTTGIDGQGVQLDGLYDYIDFDTPAGWPEGLEPRTMTGWGLTETVDPGWRWIAAYGTGATSQAMFIGLNGPDLYGGGHGDDVMLADFWAVGEWHHIGLTYDGTTARLYADGVEVATEAKNWNLVPDRAHIGRQVSDQIEFWMGLVDEVRIYSEALSPGELAWLAGKRAPVHKPF